ncbi:MAG: hypothetical protein H5T39_00660 [Methanobacteriales archaeon]|nr:hypothetical protein [Methanobacteriaceae archaeon]MBC7096197.1 hypothetical protein [Methanobacteriales archaeon]
MCVEEKSSNTYRKAFKEEAKDVQLFASVEESEPELLDHADITSNGGSEKGKKI